MAIPARGALSDVEGLNVEVSASTNSWIHETLRGHEGHRHADIWARCQGCRKAHKALDRACQDQDMAWQARDKADMAYHAKKWSGHAKKQSVHATTGRVNGWHATRDQHACKARGVEAKLKPSEYLSFTAPSTVTTTPTFTAPAVGAKLARALHDHVDEALEQLLSLEYGDAEGLDIIGVQTVINFACPRDLTSYVHRVGRTARAGREGYAVTFVTDNDRSVLKSIAKRAGSKLKSRTVAEQSIAKWCQLIEQMEDQVAEVLQEERVERALRKAEMEATKAENIIAHKDEIYARPKRTWFATEKEKKVIAKAAKDSKEKDKGLSKEVLSAEQAEDLKMKQKRKREREKNMPRKKRRRLEAFREMLDEDELDESEGNGKKDNAGKLLVDVAYKQAKAVKAASKAQNAGKFVKKTGTKPKQNSHRIQSKPEEMKELFQSEMGERKQSKGLGKKKSRNSFKSKSRYKRK
ncbi:hypothetical protein GIB67_028724 [Kingdonia uniflora]|uniref:Helicase C-terminal domain-containing protein n=1 Tax=Kingdonia uniflora TaxID=39325 RepID=A0A7J7NAH4_9MAGN|nr:hypothetical protein GIB67_028724 [Kingdonia uniflora]